MLINITVVIFINICAVFKHKWR